MLELLLALTTMVSLGVCLLAGRLGVALGVVDCPSAGGGRKRHARPTPMVGGFAVIVPALLALAMMALAQPGFALLGGVVLVMLAMGMVDDRVGLGAGKRLVVAAAVLFGLMALLPAFTLTSLRFTFLDTPVVLGAWALPFTLVSVLGLQNAVNMADGKNGLVLGMGLVWTVLLGFFAPGEMVPLLSVLAVAQAVTLVFNLRGKLFLGDAGSYSISVLLGLASIYVYNTSPAGLFADMLVVWFFLPVIDCLRLIGSRVWRRQTPFAPDRTHFHHYLHAFTPRWRYGLALYMTLVSVPSVIVAVYPPATPLLLVTLLVFYAGLYAYYARRTASCYALFARR
ncbi:hypothetical protein CCR85_05015 [Rhodothalassium salexigens]|nr:hypothetical protein [Rhodothalassium salexigens]